MRRLHWISFFVITFIIAGGCVQPATTPVTTTIPQTPVVTLPPAETTIMEKQLDFTVTPSETLLNITYNGGPGAADLQSLAIRVDNTAGTHDDRTIVDPAIGATYTFTYRGVSDASRVNIIGTFQGGYQQTVLMYYI